MRSAYLCTYSESSRPLSGSGFAGGSSSNYYRYPYDDQPVVDDLDDSAFQSAPSLDTTVADHASLPPHRIVSVCVLLRGRCV